MRGAVTLVAVLLSATTYQVDSLLPYQLTASEKCAKKEYLTQISMSDWCCSRCPPGSMLKVSCNETTDTVCEPCPSGQFMEAWNYKSSCFSCRKCGEDEGLQYLQNCTTSTRSRCVCQPGMYCDVEFNDPYCTGCVKYSSCPLGFGVSDQGTADSNTKCSPCLDGKYSDVVSHTESCKPHTRCQKAVVKQGTATSDTECDPTSYVYSTIPKSTTTDTQSTVGYTTPSLKVLRTSTPSLKVLRTSTPSLKVLRTSIPMKTDSTLTPIQSSHPASTGVKLVTVVALSVIGCVLLIIILVILVLWQSKGINRRGSQKHNFLTDTNGNSKIVESMRHNNALDTQITSMAPELQCLMDTQEPCTGRSDAPEKSFAGRKDPHVIEHDSLV